MNGRIVLPEDLKNLREQTRRAISPIKPTTTNHGRDLEYWLKAERTKAGKELPPYYLIYFLLVELLHFPHLGRWEKVAWSVSIDFKGTTYTIEHRKFGIGVFVPDAKNEEQAARQIVVLIKKGVTVAEPFFEWIALNAVRKSKLNIINQSSWLFERYRYLKESFDTAEAEAEKRRDERHEETKKMGDGSTITSVESPWYRLKQNSKWAALAAIDAFFAWTEHVFIHLAILQGRVKTGDDVACLAEAEWKEKFKVALDLSEPNTKTYYDKLVTIRRQLRNFVAHGAFGKRGQAFHFHSKVGAVPVLLTHKAGRRRFSLSGEPVFDEETALEVIEEFVNHLWSGVRAPARIYLEDAALPTILTMATDGTYVQAMRSLDDMKGLVDGVTRSFDNAANMDW